MGDNVLILDFGDTGNEAEAIRQSLEQFGYNVMKYGIGRPNDFVEILSGDSFADYKYLIISCHGSNGDIVMPKLGESVYTEDEPKNDFTADDVLKYIKIKNKIIINTGCSTGKSEEMKKAFVNDSNSYISPNDYPGATGTLFFVIALFYYLINTDLFKAFDLAMNIDEETQSFNLATLQNTFFDSSIN